MSPLKKKLLSTTILIVFILACFHLYRYYNRPLTADQTASLFVTLCATATKDHCYASKLEDVTQDKGLAHSLAVLTIIQEKDRNLRGCHFIAHKMAAKAVEKNPEAWEEVIQIAPVEACTGGFIMGALEKARHTEKELSPETIANICTLVTKKTQQTEDLKTCYHTFGHLILVEQHGNIPSSITFCSTLPDQYHYECYSGVFMENYYRRNLVSHGIGGYLLWNEATLDTLVLACNAEPGLIGQACWRELSHIVLSLTKSDPSKTYDICSKATTATQQSACYLHAAEIAALSSSTSEKQRSSYCSLFSTTIEQNMCQESIHSKDVHEELM